MSRPTRSMSIPLGLCNDRRSRLVQAIKSDHHAVEHAFHGSAGEHLVGRVAGKGFGDSNPTNLAALLQSNEDRQSTLKCRCVLPRGYRVQMKDIDIVGIETTEARMNSLFHGS